VKQVEILAHPLAPASNPIFVKNVTQSSATIGLRGDAVNKKPFAPKYYQLFGIAFLLIFAGVSCLPTFRTPTAVPLLQTVIVNREVTREVTVEVTQIVEIPVTLTPTPTPIPIDTPTPTLSPTSAASPTITQTLVPPVVSILVHTQCLYGPDPVYLNKYEILANSAQWVIGRNQDGTWLLVDGTDHKTPCWVKTGIVKVTNGILTEVSVTDPVLSPYSTLYTPPQAVSTFRADKDVTIFWQPIPMTEADYHGYLIEAWLCQAGQLVFTPLSYDTSFDQNSSMLAIKVTDESGCLEPSSARIYTVNNQGYSNWKQVPWPAWSIPSPAPTAT